MNQYPRPTAEYRKKSALWTGMLVMVLVLWVGVACKWMDSASTQSAAPTDPGTAASATAAPEGVPDATRLPATSQPAASQPPDEPGAADASGLVVVYTKTGELWRWIDGRAERLPLSSRAYAPRLSPDGSMVAYLSPVDEFHIELWAADMNTGAERKLVSVGDLDAIGSGSRDAGVVAINPYSFAWIPGESKRLAFNTHKVYNGPGLALLDDLHLVDAAGGPIQTVLQPGSGGEFAFSPDGSRVAVSRVDQIVLANADGSEYRQVLSHPQVLTYSEYRFYALPKWSPDGSFLRVAIPPADSLADPAAETALWRIPVEGGEPVREGGVSAVPFFDAPVVYSPELQRVAFIRASGANEESRTLYLATFDGRGEWAAAQEPMLRFGAWAPDGRSFVYTTGDEMSVYAGSLDAPAKPLSARCSGAVEVRWVDNARLVCAAQSPGAFELTLVDVNGSALLLDTIAGDAPVFDLRLLP